MKVGDKYIIEIEEVIRRNGAPQIARIKGFNALVFDQYGLEKLEPYEDNWENVYRKGYEDGKNAVKNESEKITSKDISDAYDKGLQDAWEFIIDKVFKIEPAERNKIFNTYFCDMVLESLSAKEAIDLYKQWEEQQKQQDAEIKVGDEVVIDDKGRKAVVSRVLDNELYNIVFYNGDTNCVDRCFIAKTGRHFDVISEVLAELRGEE